MSPNQYVTSFVLILTLLGKSDNAKMKRSKIENNSLVYKVVGISNHNAAKRQSGKNCPPPPGQGILQVKSDKLDISLTNKNKTGLENLRFMCGQAQIMKKIPIGWVMQEQEDGHLKNVTLYTSTLLYIPVCCLGYIRNEKDICVPKCKGGCKNGVCISPGNCACYQGYSENSRGECVLTCPCMCHHGKCHDYTCTCENGYVLDSQSQICEPVCPESCVNAECTAPGVCTCLQGYMRRKSDEDYACSPYCGTACKHGKCVAPDICQCDEGYQKSKSGTCVPRCAGCEHGDCVQPFQCRCHDGYRRVGDECEPICYVQCHNAACSAPDTCGCISGYVKVSPYACVPGCKPACQNADCVAPNQCECHTNYYKSSKSFLQHVCYHTSVQLISAAQQLANDLTKHK